MPFFFKKLISTILYTLFILCLIEASSYFAYKILNDKILFSEKFKIPNFNLLSFKKYYHKNLGWNELGDRENLSKDSHISCFGDSYTFGDEVPKEDSWPWILNQNTDKIVQNFGVRGYGVDQSIIKVEQSIKNDNSKHYLLSFISENISRNLIVYKPFFSIKMAHHFTKPRFIKDHNTNSFVLLPNPLNSKNEGFKLRDYKFIESLGKNDFWYQHQDPLPSTFPYSQLIINAKFWNKIYKFIKDPQNPLIRFSTKAEDIWKLDEATELQDFLIHRFFKNTQQHNKMGKLIHLPSKQEVIAYQKNNSIPLAIQHTKLFCRKHNYVCLFPLTEAPQFKEINPKELYIKYHLSKKGNQIIAKYLKMKLSLKPSNSD